MDDNLEYPVLSWGKDWVFRARTRKQFVQVDRSWLPKLQKAARAGEVHVLDSAGRMFDVVDAVQEPTSSFLSKLFGPLSIRRVLTNEQQLDLSDFKAYVHKAVSARQRYDRGSYIVENTMKTLPDAQTYREAIESLPKVY